MSVTTDDTTGDTQQSFDDYTFAALCGVERISAEDFIKIAPNSWIVQNSIVEDVPWILESKGANICITQFLFNENSDRDPASTPIYCSNEFSIFNIKEWEFKEGDGPDIKLLVKYLAEQYALQAESLKTPISLGVFSHLHSSVKPLFTSQLIADLNSVPFKKLWDTIGSGDIDDVNQVINTRENFTIKLPYTYNDILDGALA